MYQFVVFLHIFGALVFFMGHGASAFMAVNLRGEQNMDRIRTLLNLSATSLNVMFLGLLMLLLAGIAAGFMGKWWPQGWIWAALILMIFLIGWMGFYARRHYIPLRKALGITYRGVPGDPTPANPEEITRLVNAARPMMLMVGGMSITAVILFLMVFKPF